MSNAVRYSADVEHVQPDETETLGKLEEQFALIQDATAKDYGHGERAVHAKAHGIARGALTVAGGLPPELAQGTVRAGGPVRGGDPHLHQPRRPAR